MQQKEPARNKTKLGKQCTMYTVVCSRRVITMTMVFLGSNCNYEPRYVAKKMKSRKERKLAPNPVIQPKRVCNVS
jgi:hypothetical protein